MSSSCSTQEEYADLRSFRVLYSTTNGQIVDGDTAGKPANPEYEILQRGEIRLLTLHSPSDFTLERVSLTDDPQYVAASYCWGGVGELSHIRINGHSVLLRKHVFEMVRQLYLTRHVKQLWLDMIRINQSSNDEKSRQMPLMGEIYSKATRVFAWLGGADPKTDLIFDVLCTFRDCKRQEPYPDHLDSVEELSYYRDVFRDIWQVKAGSVPEKCELDDDLLGEEFNWLRPIYTRPYWSRVWIIQELILAKEVLVYCGDMCISLDDIYGLDPGWGSYEEAFNTGLHRSLTSNSRGRFTIQTICGHRRRRDHRNQVPFLVNVESSEMEQGAILNEVVEVYAQHHRCKLLKDKVYGFLELVPRWKEKLTVNYHQSDRAVFLNVARVNLFETKEGGGWYVAYTLWSAMDLGCYEDFKNCIHEAMPDIYDQNSQWLERPPRSRRSSPSWKEEAHKIFTRYKASKLGA